MRPTPRDRGNHPGICDYKGHSYVFGQNYDLMHLDTFVHHERRSVSATEIEYNADGTKKRQLNYNAKGNLLSVREYEYIRK
jgi:hypothetical protein